MTTNFNLKDAARYLCVSTSKLYKLCHKNEITYCKAGRKNVFPEEILKQYLENNKVSSNTELAAMAELTLHKGEGQKLFNS